MFANCYIYYLFLLLHSDSVTILHVASEMMRALERGVALRAGERSVLLVRQFVPLEQAVPLERFAAFLADELPFLTVYIEHVILENAHAGERLPQCSHTTFRSSTCSCLCRSRSVLVAH